MIITHKKVKYLQWLALTIALIGIWLDLRDRNSIGFSLVVFGNLMMVVTIVIKHRFLNK